ncbi:MAG: sugar phosphate isomerase/epimerase [Candidatus Cellulosilyticum pullistercoris]|uniref:Sugar phosphate isomerase/epimerase n=1 Tax=Candidatus Cellulosilyticum pullistercoris TaxID=2838521 RepID=A0A9E2KBK2_9FIRM|nr:sugar phosphate isomerase/epimerase [Candidatus Cellulosilyticum pullistercoris]
MKKLFHLSTTPKQLSMFEENWEDIKAFVSKNYMDGIELGLTIDYNLEKIPKEIIVGVHLSFYPMWLDFWRGNKEQLAKQFTTKEALYAYYKGETPECLVENYKKQYERAKALGARYMVFHVSHVLPEDSFTWQFDYTDKEVMEATLELVNRAFPNEEEGPLLLFENLWWPGLNYKDAMLTKWFIDKVQYPNKGYLVDVSHLILNNSQIGTEKQAYDYIKETIEALGETKKWIKGLHLNKTLPKHYMQRNHSYLLQKYQETKDSKQKLTILKKHINALDGHMPFDHPMAKKIVDLIQPLYCVYETAPTSRYELAYFIKKQNEVLK